MATTITVHALRVQVALSRGYVVTPAKPATIKQQELEDFPYLAETLAGAVERGHISVVSFEGETLTPARVRQLGDGVHGHSHNPSGFDPLDSSTGSLTIAEHEQLQQLIHFIDDGPSHGFLSGAFKQTVGNPFPTNEIWWTSSGMLKKIVELDITRDIQQKPIVEDWKMYGNDGVTVVQEVVDTISYSGPFETSRTRVIM